MNEEDSKAEIEELREQVKDLEKERDEIGAGLDECIQVADKACDILSEITRRFR